MSYQLRVAALIASGLGVLAAGAWAASQGTPSPRAGLTAQQTKQAVEVARQGLAELRKKAQEGAKPEADRREYVVGVELLTNKESEGSSKEPQRPQARPEGAAKDSGNTITKEAEKPAANQAAPVRGPLALVTSYHYFDDLTIFATVDLGARRIVNLEAAQHLRTALSDEEFEEAKALARERSAEVKALYEKFGERLSVNTQFSQFSVKPDPRIHRVLHLTYRVGTRDLSYPRPVIDLTTREVTTPGPEAFPKPRRPTP